MTARVEQLWPLIFVGDMTRSVEFYRDGLGFEIVGAAESGGSIYWCRLRRGGACLMLQQRDAGRVRPSDDVLYLVCDDADLVYEELRGRGVPVQPPTLAYYGMKQVSVSEPDGRTLVFESPTAEWKG